MSLYEFAPKLDTGLVDDSARNIADLAGVEIKRAECLEWLWGSDGAPSDVPSVTTDVECPILGLTGVARVDQLDYTIDGIELRGYHYVPSTPRGECLVVCHGHGHYTQGDGGHGRLIQAALSAGYGVCGVHMPGQWTDHVGIPQHPAMFETWWSRTAGSPMRIFIVLCAATLNLLEPEYSAFYAAGLSGGGWTACMLGAFDARIQGCAAVAGTWPLYMRVQPITWGDAEQTWPRFYSMAGWIDIFVMIARRCPLLMIYLHNDICFGPNQYQDTGGGQRIVGLSFAEAADDFCAEVNGVVQTDDMSWVLDQTDIGHELTVWAANRIVELLGGLQ